MREERREATNQNMMVRTFRSQLNIQPPFTSFSPLSHHFTQRASPVPHQFFKVKMQIVGKIERKEEDKEGQTER